MSFWVVSGQSSCLAWIWSDSGLLLARAFLSQDGLQREEVLRVGRGHITGWACPPSVWPCPKFSLIFGSSYVSYWDPLLWDSSCTWLSSCLARKVVLVSGLPYKTTLYDAIMVDTNHLPKLIKYTAREWNLLCDCGLLVINLAFQYRFTDCNKCYRSCREPTTSM